VASSLLVLGGARSGKSRFAIQQPLRGRVAFVATAEASDGDMARRIARHRAERPSRWTTVEEPVHLVDRLRRLGGTHDAVVVDCLTLWVANRLLRGDDDEAILAGADALSSLLVRPVCDVVLVSNEVGEGVHPETAEGRRFRDLLGFVNQRVAAASDRVVLMVAGLPLQVKPAETSSVTPPVRDDHAVQAP
jgi:adenosylcobinamide kinase/adenosylcobinamide-phosphate guanylyltransferase